MAITAFCLSDMITPYSLLAVACFPWVSYSIPVVIPILYTGGSVGFGGALDVFRVTFKSAVRISLVLLSFLVTRLNSVGGGIKK